MATIKHLSSKNSNYAAAESYLTFQHNEYTGLPILDEKGRPKLRDSYLLDTLECGESSFAMACLIANRKYGKNGGREDVKTHHYIVSFDPKDAVENGLTMERAQALGLQFCKDNFPGHPAIVCTHPDGHNSAGNIHVHIVIGSLRVRTVERQPFMDKPCDWEAGKKHRCTSAMLQINVMRPGESVTLGNPNIPTAGFPAFVKEICKLTGAGLEMPYDVLIKEFNSSYSAAKGALEEMWEMVKMRRSWFVNDFCQPIYETWLSEAVALGRIKAPGFWNDPIIRAAWCGARWDGPAQTHLDPVKEANANKIMVEKGWKTNEQVTREFYGGNWRDNMAALKREKEISDNQATQTSRPTDTAESKKEENNNAQTE